MDNKRWDVLEPDRSELRRWVAGVERELSRVGVTNAQPADPAALQGAWTALVRELALGSEPELRACSSCQRSIMATATRCRYCWSKSAAAGNGG